MPPPGELAQAGLPWRPAALLRRGCSVRIGRHPKNEIDLSSLAVSKRHCTLTLDASGTTCFITDRGSSHGTFVNGRRLSTNTVSAVRTADTVTLGSVCPVLLRIAPVLSTSAPPRAQPPSLEDLTSYSVLVATPAPEPQHRQAPAPSRPPQPSASAAVAAAARTPRSSAGWRPVAGVELWRGRCCRALGPCAQRAARRGRARRPSARERLGRRHSEAVGVASAPPLAPLQSGAPERPWPPLQSEAPLAPLQSGAPLAPTLERGRRRPVRIPESPPHLPPLSLNKRRAAPSPARPCSLTPRPCSPSPSSPAPRPAPRPASRPAWLLLGESIGEAMGTVMGEVMRAAPPQHAAGRSWPRAARTACCACGRAAAAGCSRRDAAAPRRPRRPRRPRPRRVSRRGAPRTAAVRQTTIHTPRAA